MLTLLATSVASIPQILYNLVGNSLKFTHVGRVILSVAPSATSAAEVIIKVTDTGIGIPHNKLDQIWSPFEQARLPVWLSQH
jgi:signal transduction histidine kinase